MVCQVLFNAQGLTAGDRGQIWSNCLQVVAAPTGSGKTGVLELAILRVMSQYMDPSGAFKLSPGAFKIVYLAPIRALVQEKVTHWQRTFGDKLGLTCCEMTGDTDVSDSTNLDSADIICTTPEKFGKLASCGLVPMYITLQ